MNIVFDMDGVIFDTETLCVRSWKALEQEFAVESVEEMMSACTGCNHDMTVEILKNGQRPGFPVEAFLRRSSEEMHRMINEEGIPVKKGAEGLLSWLKERGAKVALASSTRKATVEAELKLAGLYSYFDVIVGGDMVKKSKPEPDIYLCACEKLGVQPQACYAVEDSYNGVRSASRAGMRVLMVPDRLAPTDEMEELAWQIFADLNETRRYLEKEE